MHNAAVNENCHHHNVETPAPTCPFGLIFNIHPRIYRFDVYLINWLKIERRTHIKKYT